MSDLSTRVRLRREQLGLSQEELARRMGYRSRSSITKLEKGINDLPQSKVEELAQALETTPAALLGLGAPCACPPGFEPLPANGRPAHPELLSRLLRICFQQRRKQLGGIFRRAALPGLEKSLHDACIDPALRPEALTCSDFQRITAFWASQLDNKA